MRLSMLCAAVSRCCSVDVPKPFCRHLFLSSTLHLPFIFLLFSFQKEEMMKKQMNINELVIGVAYT